jgi:hypothetical protein
LQNNRSRQFPILCPAHLLLDRGELLLGGSRGQNIATMFRQSRENFCQVRWSLVFPEDHFGRTRAQSAMMIDFGESQVFERQVPQAFDGFVRRQLSCADLPEKFADGFSVQGTLSFQKSGFPQELYIDAIYLWLQAVQGETVILTRLRNWCALRVPSCGRSELYA